MILINTKIKENKNQKYYIDVKDFGLVPNNFPDISNIKRCENDNFISDIFDNKQPKLSIKKIYHNLDYNNNKKLTRM